MRSCEDKKRQRGLHTRLRRTVGFAFPVLLGVLIAQQGTGNIFDVLTHAKRGLVVVKSARQRRALKALKTAGIVVTAAVAEKLEEAQPSEGGADDVQVEVV